MTEKAWLFSLLFLLILGCSKNETSEIPSDIRELNNLKIFSSEEEPTSQIHFQKDQIFSDTDEILFERMRDIAVDKTGTVYIADGDQLNIKVFDSEGNFLTLLGREGRGPGEFQHISNLQIQNNQLHVWDGTQRRSEVLALDSYESTNSILLASNRNDYENLREAQPGKYYVRSDNNYLIKFLTVSQTEELKNPWFQVKLSGHCYLMDMNGQIISEEFFNMPSSTNVSYQAQGTQMSIHPNFFGESLVALTENDEIITTESQNFLLKIYGADGDYQRAVYYPIDRVPLTLEDAIESEESAFFHTGIELLDLPEFWPAIRSLIIDDNNHIWVATTVEDFNVYKWWVLDSEGSLISNFIWPRSKPIQEVKRDHIYTRETNDSTDVQQIVRYKINWVKQSE